MPGDTPLADLLLSGCIPVGFDLAGLAHTELIAWTRQWVPTPRAVSAGAGSRNSVDSSATLGSLVAQSGHALRATTLRRDAVDSTSSSACLKRSQVFKIDRGSSCGLGQRDRVVGELKAQIAVDVVAFAVLVVSFDVEPVCLFSEALSDHRVGVVFGQPPQVGDLGLELLLFLLEPELFVEKPTARELVLNPIGESMTVEHLEDADQVHDRHAPGARQYPVGCCCNTDATS